ncbi:MAG: phytanoyl-CoA dioxygenase family protein [Pseudomonadota bacterium]
MLHRETYLKHIDSKAAPEHSQSLESEGYTVIRDAFELGYIQELRDSMTEVYETSGIDYRAAHLNEEEQEDFRYACFNRSEVAQGVIEQRAILDVIEPLLGEDCHVIANTCWRNPPREEAMQGGGRWHIDGGPHVPHDSSIRWDDRIPYPIFAIGVHIFLKDCPMACGPTAVIPGSHKSGEPPPPNRGRSMKLTCYDRGLVALEAKAGDIAMFVSDVWHRRLPTQEDDTGRFFIQVHYARRDIAQRVLPTDDVNHLSERAIQYAKTDRQKTIIGLHKKGFYDG